MQLNQSKIIVALDLKTKDEAEAIISKLDPSLCRLKVGITLFTELGPQWVESIQAKGFEIFLDLKFHDIPFQVAGACRNAAKLGVWMINVHALGGLKMLKAAKEAVSLHQKQFNKGPLLIGVTLLTSLSEEETQAFGLTGTVEENVLRLAGLCYEAGLDGVVCSANEVKAIKETFGEKFLCVTPGIRLPGDNKHDQTRVLTPQRAVKLGSDYLVMGRSITEDSVPNAKLQLINEGIANELG